MALKIQFAFKEGNKLETIVVDAAVNEGHSFAADITDFPVEEGSNVSDNVRAKPAMLRIEAFVSDFPLTNEGRSQVSSGGVNNRPAARQNRSKDVLEQLIRLRDEGILVTVETGIRRYQNMVLQNIDMPRDKSLKAGLRLTLMFKEVRIVETQQVKLEKPREKKGEKKKDDGPKTGKKTDGEEKGSYAVKVGKSINKGIEAIKKVLPSSLLPD